ncbi:MAG: ribonuclease P protein component [bacterium]
MDKGIKRKFSLKKDNLLKKRRDFKQAFCLGKKIEDKYFQIIFADNEIKSTRMSVILGRKFGKATVRNKIRRRIKEIYRLNQEKFPSHTDYLIKPKGSVKDISFCELQDSLLHLVEECRKKERSSTPYRHKRIE